jgi:hypothetical protein
MIPQYARLADANRFCIQHELRLSLLLTFICRIPHTWKISTHPRDSRFYVRSVRFFDAAILCYESGH